MSTYTSVCGSPFQIWKRQIFRNGWSNIYFFCYCTDTGTHRVLRILRMDLFLFNFLYEAVATLQVMCTLYMQLTFYRGTIIHAIKSIISSIRASPMAAGKFPPVSFHGGRHQTPAAYIFTTQTNQIKFVQTQLISYKHEGFRIKKPDLHINMMDFITFTWSKRC